MIKTLFVGIWACLVTMAVSYGATSWIQTRAGPVAAPLALASEVRKTKEINIPIIRDGAVKGYVVTQLSYVVDLAVARTLATPPDAFVVDEAFQYIYGDEKIDFAHLDRLELDKMTQALILKVNTRLRGQVITDMGVLECNFLLNTEAKAKP
jgi:hypothetical protein